MACDEGDNDDEKIWDGDILPPYQFDDFDDEPYTELKELLKKLPQATSPALLRCSGEATSYIQLQSVTSTKNNGIAIVKDVTTTKDVTDKNSDIVKDLPQNYETLGSEVNKANETEEPPNMNNIEPYGVSETSSDILANNSHDHIHSVGDEQKGKILEPENNRCVFI